AKKPELIGVGEIVRHTEPDMALVPCFNPVNSHCVIMPACVLRGALEKARAAFVEVLDGYTLGDLIAPRSALAGLLAIGPVPPMRARQSGRRANRPVTTNVGS